MYSERQDRPILQTATHIERLWIATPQATLVFANADGGRYD